MADPSPTTASIVRAFDDRYELLGPFEDNWQEVCIAAALRAAVDQVLPAEKAPKMMHLLDLERLAARQHTRAKFLAIAAELEAA
jgi:hypothetical protein